MKAPFTPAMTRRAALTGGLLGAAALAGCSGDNNARTSRDHLPGPQRIREQGKHLAPATYVQTYVVDSAGKNGAYPTFAAAYAAIGTDRAKRIGVTAPAQAVPWDWRRILVSPGTYHECLKGVPPFTAVIGTGKSPTDTRIWWDGQDNTFESTGRSVYVHNIHLDHTNPDPDAHAMRDNGPAGDVGLVERQRRTVVYDSVHFSSLRSASLGKCTNDMAPMAGVSLTFRNCVFDGPGQPQSVNLITNQGSGSAPSTVSFVGCKVISNHEQHPDKDRLQLGTSSAAPFGAPDFAHGRRDRVLWMDGSWDVGKVGGVQALIVLPYIDDKKQTGVDHPRAATQYILSNPGAAPGITTVKTQKVLPPLHSIPADLDLPEQCFSAQEKAFFGARPSSDTQHVGTPSADAEMTLAAGAVYWVSIDLAGASLFPTSVEIGAQTQGTLSAAVVLDDSGKPSTDGNAASTGRSSGKNSRSTPMAAHWFFPGQGRLWVGVSCDVDTKVPASKAESGRALQGTGASAGQLPTQGLSPVPAGTLIPQITVDSRLPEGMR